MRIQFLTKNKYQIRTSVDRFYIINYPNNRVLSIHFDDGSNLVFDNLLYIEEL